MPCPTTSHGNGELPRPLARLQEVIIVPRFGRSKCFSRQYRGHHLGGGARKQLCCTSMARSSASLRRMPLFQQQRHGVELKINSHLVGPFLPQRIIVSTLAILPAAARHPDGSDDIPVTHRISTRISTINAIRSRNNTAEAYMSARSPVGRDHHDAPGASCNLLKAATYGRVPRRAGCRTG